jgi:hypothetical protein
MMDIVMANQGGCEARATIVTPDAHQRLEAGDLEGQPGRVGRVDHRRDVLVRARRLLRGAAIGAAADEDAARGELVDEVAPAPVAQRLVATHRAPGAVTGRPEGERHAPLGSGEHVRARAHAAADEHGLAEIAKQDRERGVARAPGSRRALAIRALYDHVLALGATARVDRFLHSAGGSLDVPWRIVTMLRQLAPRVEVVVPYKAMSAATLVCIGADAIVMGPKAELGPFEPQLTFQRATGIRVVEEQLGLEDLFANLHFLRRRVGIREPAALGAPLVEELPVTLIGQVERTRASIRSVARKLLRLRAEPQDEAVTRRLVRSLAGWSRPHGHAIVRGEADELGFPIVDPSPTLAARMWELYTEYEGLCQQRTPFDPESFLGPEEERVARVVLGCIESRDVAHHLAGEVRVRRRRRLPRRLTFVLNLSVGAPLAAAGARDLRDELLRGIEHRTRELVRDEIRRHGVPCGHDTSLQTEWLEIEGWRGIGAHGYAARRGCSARRSSASGQVLTTSRARHQPRRATSTPWRSHPSSPTRCASLEITNRAPASRAMRT